METTKKIYAPHELICAEPIHPGEMLKDELQARGISQRKFAGIIGMPYTAFNEIINGAPTDHDRYSIENRGGNGDNSQFVDRLTI